ncbi:MAG TPA: hotdog domain-containing protein [Candidatus Dormibacteraeota bacterium]|nr:hotdog domain-containing protein [Candidatus Dormibacteraeota bacterium]
MSDHAALAELAASVRRLIDATVTVDADAVLLRAAAQRVDAVAADLRVAVPDPPPPRYPGGGDTPMAFFPYDVVIGRCNPLAAPMEMRWEDPLAIGEVAFGTAYEGPQGCVHGGVIAAAFDQVLNVANLMSGNAGPTARLQMRYRKPTPLHRPLRFEGWVAQREERKVHSAGRLLVDDVVTVEAEGLYIIVDPERVVNLLG